MRGPIGQAVPVFVLLLVTLGACRERQPAYPPLLPEAQALMARAEQAFAQQQFSRAIALADSAEVLQPEHPDMLFFKGRVYTHMRLLDEADSLYRLVARRVPDYPASGTTWPTMPPGAGNSGRRLPCFSESWSTIGHSHGGASDGPMRSWGGPTARGLPLRPPFVTTAPTPKRGLTWPICTKRRAATRRRCRRPVGPGSLHPGVWWLVTGWVTCCC
nr:tetratricopeptide repeat protein [Rhodothermus marinus]